MRSYALLFTLLAPVAPQDVTVTVTVPIECPACPVCPVCLPGIPRAKAMKYFGLCMTGPNQPIVGRVGYVPCDWLVDCIGELDADGDDDIDLKDWATWMNRR